MVILPYFSRNRVADKCAALLLFHVFFFTFTLPRSALQFYFLCCTRVSRGSWTNCESIVRRRCGKYIHTSMVLWILKCVLVGWCLAWFREEMRWESRAFILRRRPFWREQMEVSLSKSKEIESPHRKNVWLDFHQETQTIIRARMNPLVFQGRAMW